MSLGFRAKLTLATTAVVALAVLLSLSVTQGTITNIYLSSLAERSTLSAKAAQSEQEAVTFALRTSTWTVTNNVRLLAAQKVGDYRQLYLDLEFEFSRLREASEALSGQKDGAAAASVPPGGIFRYVKPDGPAPDRIVPPPTAVNAGDFPQDPGFREHLFLLLDRSGPKGERSAHIAVSLEPWWVLALPVMDNDEAALLGWIVLALPDTNPVQAPNAEETPPLAGLRVGDAWAASPALSPAQRALVSQILDAAGDSQTISGAEAGPGWRLYAQPLRTPGLPTAWRVLLFSTERLQRDINSVRQLTLLLGAGLMLGAFGIASLLSHNLSRPLIRLRDATKAVERGDFSVRVASKTSDEFGQLTESFNQMTSELALKERYKSVLDKVTDPEVARRLVHGEISLGGELRAVSILFCDIRGFTSLTEGMDPVDVIAMLNEHMTALTTVANRHRGVVDKFSGDEIMVVFGAPESYGSDALNAARCALGMIAERERLNRVSPRPINVGIGIATGVVVAGCMGSVDRLNYTVLGARVNLAARLCGKAGPMEILVDEATRVALLVGRTEPLDEMELKGFSLAHFVHRLVDLDEPGRSVS